MLDGSIFEHNRIKDGFIIHKCLNSAKILLCIIFSHLHFLTVFFIESIIKFVGGSVSLTYSMVNL
jgi:hypothetical protein